MTASTHTTAPAPATGADPVLRGRLAVVAVALVVTTVIAVVGGLLWPGSTDGDWYRYGDLAPVRDRWWSLVTLMSVSLVVNVPAQAIAAMALVRRRGAGWATTGAVVMWLGTGLQAAGAAGWAMLYYFTTDPSLDPAAATSLLDRIADDPRLLGAGLAGALLVALGTVVQAVGLWRSRAVPRWVPVLTLVAPLTFFLPNEGVAGLITAVPMAVGAVALGWYAWRRA